LHNSKGQEKTAQTVKDINDIKERWDKRRIKDINDDGFYQGRTIGEDINCTNKRAHQSINYALFIPPRALKPTSILVDRVRYTRSLYSEFCSQGRFGHP